MNAMLAQLNRRLHRRGEWVYVRRNAGTGASNTSYVEAKVKAFIKALTVDELIAGITQQNFLVTISPTHLEEQQWPGGSVIAAGFGLIPVRDSAFPRQNDKVILRGTTKNVERIVAVWDGDECIRIELAVKG